MEKRKHNFTIFISMFIVMFLSPMFACVSASLDPLGDISNDYGGDYSIAGDYFAMQSALYRGSTLTQYDLHTDPDNSHLRFDNGQTVITEFDPNFALYEQSGMLVYKAFVKTITPVNIYTDYLVDDIVINRRGIEVEKTWLRYKVAEELPAYADLDTLEVIWDEFKYNGLRDSRYDGNIEVSLKFSTPEERIQTFDLSDETILFNRMEYVQQSSVISKSERFDVASEDSFDNEYINAGDHTSMSSVSTTDETDGLFGDMQNEVDGFLTNNNYGVVSSEIVNTNMQSYTLETTVASCYEDPVGKDVPSTIIDDTPNIMRFKLSLDLQPGLGLDTQEIVVSTMRDNEALRIDSQDADIWFGFIPVGHDAGIICSPSAISTTYVRTVGFQVTNLGMQYYVESTGYLYSYIQMDANTDEAMLDYPELYTGESIFDLSLRGETDIVIPILPGSDPIGDILDNLLALLLHPVVIIIVVAIVGLYIFIQFGPVIARLLKKRR